MSDKPSAVLVAEIGSITTRVTLIDVVEGESRMIGRAEVLSSIEPPYQNALVAILEGAARIAELTGRQLLDNDQLLMPQNNERDGIDHVVSLTSAAGNLALVITAVATDVSARSALHVGRSTYTSILQVVTLDDATNESVHTTSSESWISRQIEAMLALQPDVVLIAGGLEGGAVESLSRLAHIVALTALRTSVDVSGQQRQDIMVRPVVYAGNSVARERVLEALSGRAETIIVDNIRPILEQEHLEPARQELQRLYNERILGRLPGIPALRRLSRVPISTVCNAEGLVTRFMAERYARHVLTLDVGSASSSAFLASQGHYHAAVLGSCGTGYGLTAVLNENSIANIARWLPFSISAEDLTHWLLNKLLRPQLLPMSREDVLIEHAVAQEALNQVLTALYDEVPNPAYDMIVAGGGVLAHAPHPGMAILTLLNALQPTAQDSTLALDVYLDILGLLPATGALATLDPDAAVTIFDRDLLRNVPLATCVVTLGDGRMGEVALEAELTSRGHTQRMTVRHGQIMRLPLEQGARGKLTLKPAPGVRVGRNAPGVEVSSDIAAISGSALGIVIDARGRPLKLPDDEQQRCARLREWLIALEAEGEQEFARDVAAVVLSPEESFESDISATESPNGSQTRDEPLPVVTPEELPQAIPEPDVSTADIVEVGEVSSSTSEVSRIKPGTRISLSDLAAQEQDEPVPSSSPADVESTGMDRDLAKLRQSVEEPKKRGWFGRKK